MGYVIEVITDEKTFRRNAEDYRFLEWREMLMNDNPYVYFCEGKEQWLIPKVRIKAIRFIDERGGVDVKI